MPQLAPPLPDDGPAKLTFASSYPEGSTLKLGSEIGYPPFSVLNEQGEADGFAVDLFKAVARVMGFELEIHTGSWDQVKSAMLRGELDALPLLSHTEDWDRQFDFTQPHTLAAATAFVREGSPAIEEPEDLKGLSILALNASAAAEYLSDNPTGGNTGLTVTLEEALQRLDDGDVDAVLAQRLVGLTLIHQMNFTRLVASDLMLPIYGRGFAFAVAEGNQALQQKLNQGLRIIKATGEYDRLYEHWFGVVAPIGISEETLYRYIGGALLTFLVIAILASLWLWSLKGQIRQREQAEQLAEERASQIRNILDLSPVGFGITVDGFLQFHNRRLTQMMDIELGQQATRVYSDAAQQQEVYRLLEEQGDVRDHPLLLNARDGTTFDVLASFRRTTFNGQPAILGWFYDVSEMKQLTDQLTEAKRTAEQANAAKSEFLANMSHEIRTPMNSILGMSHLALETELTERQRDQIEKVNQSAQTLLGILNDILDFSKIEAGKLDMEHIDFAIQQVLDSVATVIGLKAEEKGLRLNFQLGDKVPAYVVGDPLRLGQVLLNLCNNAVKFTDCGGRIDVRVSARDGNSDPCPLRFEVQDSGIGMDKDTINQLFRPFAQADSSTTRQYGGTGLGLVISKSLVEQMHGQIGVSSTPQQGSTFWFELALPLGRAPQVEEVESSAVADALQGLRILLVEDNELNQELAMELLRARGIEVVLAENGEEALQRLPQQDFDMVLMDCQMPVMDGYTATRAIRQQDDYRQLPIIAMTANTMAGDREKALEAGMNDHIAKPVNIDEMFNTIARWARPGSA